MLEVNVRVHLVLMRDREDLVVVVQAADDRRTDRLRLEIERRLRRSPSASAATTTTAATTALRGDVELVRYNHARVAGLRIRADVSQRSADEHVEILHVLGPLADQHVASPLPLHEL